MQIDKLYPTVGTGDIETTAGITSIEDDRVKTDFFDPYLMGYLTPENAPINICPIKYTLGDSLDVSPVNSNIGWGYLVEGNASYYAKTIYRTDGNEITQYNSGGGDRYLINSVEMARVCLSGNIDIIIFTRFIMDDYYTEGVGVSELVRGGQGAGNIQVVNAVFSISDFLEKYKNGGTFLNTTVRDTSAVSPVYNIDFPLNIDFNDMPKDGTNTLYIPFPEHGCTVAVQIIGYTISADTSITNNGVTRTANIKPFAAYSFDDNKIAIIPGRYERNIIRFEFDTSTLQFANLSSYSDSSISYTPIDDTDGYLMGAFDVHFTSALFANANNQHNFIFGNTYYCDSASNATTMVFRLTSVFGIDDIYKYLLLFHKNTTTPSDTYSTDDTVSIFTSNDTPTMDTMSGTLTEIVSRLRPWQMPNVDITSNEFTPEDIPPEPGPGPGPTPQETEPKFSGYPTLGYSTRVIPKAGVNFYALNASLTSTFIQRLWSQPKNFYEAIQIAGNQVDSIFDYIQSFRFYPLNFDFSTSNIYPVIFGTGAVLKDADGDTNFQLSEATQIQHTVTAGVWNLSDPIYHWRNNFLDYSPYLKMSIYIPFAGTIELSPEAIASHSDITAATITLYASFDIGTGTITYYVANQANVLLAQKTVKIAIDLPLSGNNSAEQSAAILRAQFSTVKQLLGAGTSAVMGAATGNMAGVASAAVSTLGSVGDMYLQNSLAQRAVPVEIQGMGGTFSALAGGQYPYITINRQKVSNPPNYAHTTGYLVEGTYKISNLNGLTVCRNVDVSGISQATDKEKAQIKQILESGFYA